DRVERLRAEASRRGVDPMRLVFAPAEAIDRYLARFRLADVFIDSAPFGSHTTVNDALFMGLPVITIAGRSFAARASASQLNAIGQFELIAASFDQYVDIATALATDGDWATRISRQLADSKRRSALFDMERYTAAFEKAVVDAFQSAA